MQTTVTATEARIHFGEIMQDAVHSRQPIIVEKAGKPQVVILAYDYYQQLVNKEADKWRAMLKKGHAMVKADLNGRNLPSGSAMIEEGRRARDEELTDLR